MHFMDGISMVRRQQIFLFIACKQIIRVTRLDREK